MPKPIHQEIVIKAAPKRVYQALTNTKQFSELTGGAPAELSPEAGGSFSCFGGMIEGRNIELEPERRIVQAWRASTWPPGVYSIAKFELVAQGANTKLIFDHTAFPDDQREHLEKGWHENYWEPLKKYLG